MKFKKYSSFLQNESSAASDEHFEILQLVSLKNILNFGNWCKNELFNHFCQSTRLRLKRSSHYLHPTCYVIKLTSSAGVINCAIIVVSEELRWRLGIEYFTASIQVVSYLTTQKSTLDSNPWKLHVFFKTQRRNQLKNKFLRLIRRTKLPWKWNCACMTMESSWNWREMEVVLKQI